VSDDYLDVVAIAEVLGELLGKEYGAMLASGASE
jgi:hypothetical protein